MPTIKNFVDGTVPHEVTGGRMGVAQNILDFSQKNVLSGNVVQLLKIDERFTVYDVAIEILTPEGSAAGGTIGDTDDVDGFMAAVDLNAAVSPNPGQKTLESDAYSTGRSYTGVNTIDLIPNADLDTARIRVSALYGWKLHEPLVNPVDEL